MIIPVVILSQHKAEINGDVHQLLMIEESSSDIQRIQQKRIYSRHPKGVEPLRHSTSSSKKKPRRPEIRQPLKTSEKEQKGSLTKAKDEKRIFANTCLVFRRGGADTYRYSSLFEEPKTRRPKIPSRGGSSYTFMSELPERIRPIDLQNRL